MPTTIDKESAFADLIRDHENQWVALIEKDGVEYVVGSGVDPNEAVNDAKANGYSNAMLFKVPSFKSTFIPSASSTETSPISY